MGIEIIELCDNYIPRDVAMCYDPVYCCNKVLSGVQRYHTIKRSYEAMETEWQFYFGRSRYSDYQCFIVTLDKLVRSKRV